MTKRSRGLGMLIAAIAALFGMAEADAGSWDHGHGDAGNSGFADVTTLPAKRPDVLVSGIGSYAPGVGPVLGPDGTIYLGSREGILRALRPDGGALWQLALGAGQMIMAPPVVDTDGSIYLVGARTVTDHRGETTVRRTDSTLFHVLPGGQLDWASPFPERFAGTPVASRGTTTASPTIWRFGYQPAAVMVPAVYRRSDGAQEYRLLAFERFQGAVVRDQVVSFKSPGAITNDSTLWDVVSCVVTFCWIPGFTVSGGEPFPEIDRLPADLSPPMASPALIDPAGGGAPLVVVNDPWTDLVAYRYGALTGFQEAFRTREPAREYATSPMALPIAGGVYAATRHLAGSLRFFTTQPTVGPDRDDAWAVFAPPARTADGRVVTVSRYGRVQAVAADGTTTEVELQSESMAAAAISRSHIFVSTASGLHSFDAATLAEVATVPWGVGGQSTPAIGATGRVYALANDILYGWPAPARCQWAYCGPTPVRTDR